MSRKVNYLERYDMVVERAVRHNFFNLTIRYDVEIFRYVLCSKWYGCWGGAAIIVGGLAFAHCLLVGGGCFAYLSWL